MTQQYAIEDHQEVYADLVGNFEYYAENLLTIKPRAGGAYIPFRLNKAQRWLNAQFDNDLKERGRVRALVPKARQLGCSTLTAGRFYHRTANNFGIQTMILTHRADATDTLFAMVKQFYEDCEEFPLPLAPELGYSNKKELKFPKLKSGYTVGTERGAQIGRSMTLQLLHLSEIAFYTNAEQLAGGLMRAVHEQDGTEIIVESTGNGPTGTFHTMCREAIKNKNTGPWKLYFLPWNWDDDYTSVLPPDFSLPPEFEEYRDMHKITDQQAYWFYLQNYTTATMHGAEPELIFPITKQEYPMTVEECFQHTAETKFFGIQNIIAARSAKSRPTEGSPKILGVDPAGDGDDATFICSRQGISLGHDVYEELKTPDPNAQADIIVQRVYAHDINVVVIDVTGLGLALSTLLRMKLPKQVILIKINFGSKAINKLAHANKKAELYWNFLVWLMPSEFDRPSIPNDDTLVSEMLGYNWAMSECYRDDRSILHITQKEKVKKIIGHSPDRLEAALLTTAFQDNYLVGKLLKIEEKLTMAGKQQNNQG